MNRDLAARIAIMGPARRELLERKLAQHGSRQPPIERTASGRPVPASAAQRSQWFVHQLDPGNRVFNKTDAVRIEGDLDVVALQRAVAVLIERHEPLRTTYRLEESGLVQIIGSTPDTVLTVEQLDADTAGVGPGGLHEGIRQREAEPFDLSADLMYRTRLYRLGPSEHVLTRTTHHIAFDKWSAAIANRELSELYAAFREGRPPELDDLSIRYTDYAAWQHSLMSDRFRQAHLDFYTAHLAGAPVAIRLPTDRETRLAISHDASSIEQPLGADLSGRVREAARASGATPFMWLLAVFGLLMSRWSREEQLLVGIPLAGRTAPQLEKLIGVFINTGVIRIDTRGAPSFVDILRRVRTATLGVVAHQDLPFDELVREMAPVRPPDRTPLFQIMFDYINTPTDRLDLAGTRLEPLAMGDESAVYDLTLFIHDRRDSLEAVWEYRTDLFDRPTIGSLAQAFSVVLHESLDASHTTGSALPLVSHEARGRIEKLGRGARREVEPASVVELVLTTAAQHPAAVAVRGSHNSVAYGMLQQRIRQVASQLAREGVTKGSTVGVMTGRHPEFPAALLGVMAAGAVAVLLDPDQPDIRLDHMIRVADPDALIVAGTSGRERVQKIVDIEDLEPHEIAASGLPPIDPTDPAYIVFTSGSTGTPKGVAISHGSLVNFVSDCVDRYGLSPDDRVLQFASIGFDTVLEETLPALAAGASIVIAPPDRYPSFDSFARHVEAEKVTVLDLPTAWWHAWVGEMDNHGGEVPESVRLVIVGGEVASAARWEAWRRLAPPHVRWINTYGPAEATIVVATFEPPPDWRPTGSDALPIGYPIANADLSVVDAGGELLPLRMVGELVVSGAPVGLGYLGSEDDGGFGDDRMSSYRTGDLVRMLPDGMLEFVGRVDGQLKIRGSRVEPGEVEAAIRTHPSVREAVVVGRKVHGSVALAAHVVADEEGVGDIERHVASRLPAPLVPTSWTMHDRLPTTVGGKVDRRSLELLEPEGAMPVGSTEHDMSNVERRIAGIFEAVLDSPMPIGPSDHFFELGGHSLLGVRLISRLSEAFGIELPLRSLFEAGTVRSMAKLLEDAEN